MRILTALLVCSNLWWFLLYFIQRNDNDKLKEEIRSLELRVQSLRNDCDKTQAERDRARYKIRSDQQLRAAVTRNFRGVFI